ncbi:MAG: methylated-DNA--[protein]-cysteine S-methyltransferase [Crocinitomicaceae bacterium]|nr:methylated-DNA--[protein]-cysteine S-methyltransferase [Crocinitomicaceae bacterium]
MSPIYYDEISTPLGNMQVGITEAGIVMFEFPIEERISQHKKKFSKLFEETSTPPNNTLGNLETQITEYFEGNRTSFDLTLNFIGTDFQHQVWSALLEIPFGKTISYLDLAKSLNNPEDVRAVAHANGQNRLPILVPCHRVLASDGKLTGFSGGITRKETLLSLESGQGRLSF